MKKCNSEKQSVLSSNKKNNLFNESVLSKRIGTRISIGIERDLHKYIIRTGKTNEHTK